MTSPIAREILNPARKTGAHKQAVHSWNLPQRRARIRRHLTDARNSAHNFSILTFPNTAAAMLDEFFQGFYRSVLQKILRVYAAVAVEIPDQKIVEPVGAKVSCSGGVDARTSVPFHPRRIPQNRYLMIFGLNRQIVRDLPKQGYPWQQLPPARRSLGTNPTDVLMF
jgi:hypothetical protein